MLNIKKLLQTPHKYPLVNSNSVGELSVGKTTCGPDETECPDACCPVANWFCCPNGRYCAETPDKCPLSKSNSSMELSAARSTCAPDETQCPDACCPVANWFCCPDGRYCAETPDKCPLSKSNSTKELSKSNSFKELTLARTTCAPDETECPNGCCMVANWYCCPDGRYCAATPDKCPLSKYNSTKELSTARSTCAPDEKECGQKCCGGTKRHCCSNSNNIFPIPFCAEKPLDCYPNPPPIGR